MVKYNIVLASPEDSGLEAASCQPNLAHRHPEWTCPVSSLRRFSMVPDVDSTIGKRLHKQAYNQIAIKKN